MKLQWTNIDLRNKGAHIQVQKKLDGGRVFHYLLMRLWLITENAIADANGKGRESIWRKDHTVSGAGHRFKKAARRAGIEDVSFHTFLDDSLALIDKNKIWHFLMQGSQERVEKIGSHTSSHANKNVAPGFIVALLPEL